MQFDINVDLEVHVFKISPAILLLLTCLACSGGDSAEEPDTDAPADTDMDMDTDSDTEAAPPDAACLDFCSHCGLSDIWGWESPQACAAYCESQRDLSETCDEVVGELNACVVDLSCPDTQTFAATQNPCGAEYQALEANSCF